MWVCCVWNGINSAPTRVCCVWNGINSAPTRVCCVWNGMNSAPTSILRKDIANERNANLFPCRGVIYHVPISSLMICVIQWSLVGA